MHLPKPLHTWNVSAKEAIDIQKQLASAVIIQKMQKPCEYIAGLDAAFSPDGKTCFAAVVLWDIQRKKIIEQHTASAPVFFPYIPGLLSFREAPALLEALQLLKIKPDVLMCDGQGIAHPRRLGIASHLGLLTDLPALGCGKSRLVGKYQEPSLQQGAKSDLMHKGEKIGIVLRTKTNIKPIFVSIGHQLDLTAAENIVIRCYNGYRLPEPTRLADRLVAQYKTSCHPKEAKLSKDLPALTNK